MKSDERMRLHYIIEHAVRWSESLAAIYFAALAVVSGFRPLPQARRVRIVGASVAAILIAWSAPWAPRVVRDWLPPVLILVGYQVSGWFFTNPSEGFERWLMATDRWLLGDPVTRFETWPAVLLAYLEVVYVGCFLLVPAGFALLWFGGRADLADRYWTMVIAAEFGSFAPLAFVQTRPPWALEPPPALRDRAVHRAAAWFVREFTIGANTFPSGHVAGSLAVAFAVLPALPLAGSVLLGLALSIAAACIVGRYHYVVDVVAGAGLVGAIFTVVRLIE